jgi:hypothetical protein
LSRDEGIDHIVRRIAALVGSDWPVNGDGRELIRTTCEWPATFEELRQLVEYDNPDVILIDSLSSVTTSLGIGVPDMGDGEKWHSLVNAYRSFDRPSCILHHATKPHEGRPSTYRGSTGIGAAVDLIIEMEGKEAGSLRVLKRAGRWVLPKVLLDWEGEDGGYRILSMSEEMLTLRTEDLLWKWPSGLTEADPSKCGTIREVERQIAALTGKKHDTVRKARQRLKNDDPIAHTKLIEAWGLADE